MSNAPDHEDRGPDGPAPSLSSEEATDSGPRSSSSPDARQRRSRKQLPIWQELIILLGIALVLAVVIKTFFLQAFYIPSGSMEQTLRINDRILVEKVSYWGGGKPQRGDVVVFSDPGGWLDPAEETTASTPVAKALETFGLYPTGGHLVKRVIGVGGDEVKCCDKAGHMLVNGVPLHESSYVDHGEPPSLIKFDIKVQPGYLWVQGDNRSNSADSRVHLGDPGGGQVPVSDVVGKVFAVIWPWQHATLLGQPKTFQAVASASR